MPPNAPENVPSQIAQPQVAEVVLPKKHHKILKTFLWILGSVVFILMLILLIPNILGLVYKDIPVTDDSDLHLSTITMSDDQNALHDLEKALAVFVSPKVDVRDLLAGKQVNETLTGTTIAANKDALKFFSLASEKDFFQDSAAAHPETFTPATVLPKMGSWRSIAGVNNLYALELASAHKPDQAIEEALKSVTLGKKIMDSQPVDIEWLVGLSVYSQGIETIQHIIASSSVSSPTLIALARTLQNQMPIADGAVRAIKLEYQSMKNQISILASGETDVMDGNSVLTGQVSALRTIDRTSFYFHPNETNLAMAKDTRQSVSAASAACSDSSEGVEVQKLAPNNLWKLYVTPNAIGLIIHDIISVNVGTGLNEKVCQALTLARITQTTAALKAFVIDTKKQPRTFADLVPKYLSEVPLDPHTGSVMILENVK